MLGRPTNADVLYKSSLPPDLWESYSETPSTTIVQAKQCRAVQSRSVHSLISLQQSRHAASHAHASCHQAPRAVMKHPLRGKTPWLQPSQKKLFGIPSGNPMRVNSSPWKAWSGFGHPQHS